MNNMNMKKQYENIMYNVISRYFESFFLIFILFIKYNYA